MKQSINHFTDLHVWKLGRDLKNKIYTLTKSLPMEEKYNLITQLRRAGVSVTANIAEGYGRYHFQENIQFCRQSRGSLYEIQDHLITCLDQKYIDRTIFDEIYDLSMNTIRTLDGYIRSINKHKRKMAP